MVYGQPNFSSYIGRSYGCGEFSPTSLFFPSLTLGMMSKCGRKRHLPKTSIELKWTVKFHKSHKKFGWHGDSSLFFKCFHKTSNTLSGHYGHSYFDYSAVAPTTIGRHQPFFKKYVLWLFENKTFQCGGKNRQLWTQNGRCFRSNMY